MLQKLGNLTAGVVQNVVMIEQSLRLGYRMLTRLVDHSEGVSCTGCCGC